MGDSELTVSASSEEHGSKQPSSDTGVDFTSCHVWTGEEATLACLDSGIRLLQLWISAGIAVLEPLFSSNMWKEKRMEEFGESVDSWEDL